MAQLYAIVGSVERALLMLEGHTPYLQLRFKEESLKPHADEITSWPAQYPRTRLIINDDLNFAESVGAWGVHLGQQDLLRYPPARLRRTKLNLGISTHSDGEIARARSLHPAMLGFGPVFPTGTKNVGHAPQGLARLGEIVRSVPLPIVAIGGINSRNLADVVGTGAAMVAMISALDSIGSPTELRNLMESLQDETPES